MAAVNGGVLLIMLAIAALVAFARARRRMGRGSAWTVAAVRPVRGDDRHRRQLGCGHLLQVCPGRHHRAGTEGR